MFTQRSPLPSDSAKKDTPKLKPESSKNSCPGAANKEMHRSLSDPDLSPLSVRSKKRTRDDLLSSDLADFKEEMKSMITSLLTAQEREMKKIGTSLKEIQSTNQSIEAAVSFLSAQNEEYKKKIETLEKNAIEDKKYITVLEDKIEDLQITSRKSNFELKNVPKENSETKENLVSMVLKLSETIGCQLNKEEIKDIYRVRSKKEGTRSMPIVVETSSTILKTEFLKCCKTYNMNHKNKLTAKHLGFRTNVDTPIYVSEQLTAKGSRLHFLARDLQKTKRYKYCWTAYGKVYLKKHDHSPVITVRSESQVQQLINED